MRTPARLRAEARRVQRRNMASAKRLKHSGQIRRPFSGHILVVLFHQMLAYQSPPFLKISTGRPALRGGKRPQFSATQGGVPVFRKIFVFPVIYDNTAAAHDESRQPALRQLGDRIHG